MNTLIYYALKWPIVVFFHAFWVISNKCSNKSHLLLLGHHCCKYSLLHKLLYVLWYWFSSKLNAKANADSGVEPCKLRSLILCDNMHLLLCNVHKTAVLYDCCLNYDCFCFSIHSPVWLSALFYYILIIISANKEIKFSEFDF